MARMAPGGTTVLPGCSAPSGCPHTLTAYPGRPTPGPLTTARLICCCDDTSLAPPAPAAPAAPAAAAAVAALGSRSRASSFLTVARVRSCTSGLRGRSNERLSSERMCGGGGNAMSTSKASRVSKEPWNRRSRGYVGAHGCLKIWCRPLSTAPGTDSSKNKSSTSSLSWSKNSRHTSCSSATSGCTSHTPPRTSSAPARWRNTWVRRGGGRPTMSMATVSGGRQRTNK
mmetsp:Transcript_3597/g.8181  ORF Transcript_3597/g.8181 Transcript_3597/m.8181 type:complete len:228 (-) Transcript_3597:15-698(-)